MGHRYASTVVSALSARSAVGHRYASTVVSALDARSAVVHQCASTVVSAEDARSARSSEHIINQITPSQSVLVPSPFTRPPPPPFLHKSLSHHEAGSKITVAEVQSTRRWPLQQTNTRETGAPASARDDDGGVPSPGVGHRREEEEARARDARCLRLRGAHRSPRVPPPHPPSRGPTDVIIPSPTGHPERCVSLPATRSHRPCLLPVSQVKPEHVDAYRRNAPMYVTEETERAERWDAFLSQSREEVADASSISGDVNTNGNSASGASASTSGDAFGRRTLDAVVRVLEARAVRGAEGCRVAGAETSRTIPDEERELNALVAVSLFLSSYVQLV